MPSVNGLPRQTSGRYKSQIIPVNNIIGLDKYYRSAHLLLRQVLFTHPLCEVGIRFLYFPAAQNAVTRFGWR